MNKKDNNSIFLRKSLLMSVATFLSRILGFFRVILASNYLGGGVFMSAWVAAFKVPNMFRRLLGEGALGTALVPLITHTIESKGAKTAKEQFNTIFLFLGLLLAILSILVGVISYGLSFCEWETYIKICFQLIPILIPYALFICLTGVATSLLNSLGEFFKPALIALLMNISFIIAFLIFGPMFFNKPLSLLNSLAIAVLIAGIGQLALSLFLLKKYDFFPKLNLKYLRNTQTIKDLWKLTLPGLIGAGVLQISVLIDTILALSINEFASPALECSERLIYLPIGVFAVAIGAVSLTKMSKAAAKKDYDDLIETMTCAVRQLLFICIPISIFLVFYSNDVIIAVFHRGRFDMQAVSETAYALRFYALGIPFFAMIKPILSGFYSRKEMTTPFKVSLICITTNIILNLILMQYLKQGGIALATVLSSILNSVILLTLLKKKFNQLHLIKIFITFIVSSIIAVFAINVLDYWFQYLKNIEIHLLFKIGIEFILFFLFYLLINYLCKRKETEELFAVFFKKF